MRHGEHDLESRLRVAAERDPAESARGHVVAHLEAERVAVEGDRLVDIADGDVAVLECRFVRPTGCEILLTNELQMQTGDRSSRDFKRALLACLLIQSSLPSLKGTVTDEPTRVALIWASEFSSP